MSQPLNNPQDDADRIRLKRLAKLQSGVASVSSSAGPSTPAAATPQRQPTPKRPTPAPAPVTAPPPAASTPPRRKPATAPVKLDVSAWADETIGTVFGVTLNKEVAERSGWEVVWLKPLAEELEAEGQPRPLRMSADLADRLLIARLDVDPKAMSDDLEFLPVLASLPADQSVFEYLVGCWKRANAARSALLKRAYPPLETQQAGAVLDKLRDLTISYAGLTLQDAEMFPQPNRPGLGAPELVGPLMSLSALSAPLHSSASTAALDAASVIPFLHDLSRRFEPDGELVDVLAPVISGLLLNDVLLRDEGLADADAGWRRVLAGLEALVGVKGVPAVLTSMEQWCPPDATPANFEVVSLMGPLCHLGVFTRDWPHISDSYFTEPDKRSRGDVDSSFASLRGTMKSLQGSLFHIFNALVRAGPIPREAVLAYFARVVTLNVRRAGMHIDPDSVASDSFMVNLQSILLRFAEPFMDAKYSKLDRVDRLYLARSTRVDLTEETRINADSKAAAEWVQENQASAAAAPNFISDVFFLTVAIGHYGVQQTFNRYEEALKQYHEMKDHLQMLQGDGSWMGTPFQGRVQAAIDAVKAEQSKVLMSHLAFQTQLEDPEFVFRSINFSNFVSTWLIRFVDPKHLHPEPLVELPLPSDVPMEFKVLPEYMLEDIIETFLFFARSTPQSLELAGKNEAVVFALTFLSSTKYIKNPFLKAKLVEILFHGILPYGHERTNGPLSSVVHEHPIALKHLMPALVHFYVEVEQTGASSQFYDKFSSRRSIAYILKSIWNNPVHREALNREAKNIDKFVRFVNLMINDVTYLMDESLDSMTKIHEVQTEMADVATWATRTPQYKKETEKKLRELERKASGYCQLAKSTVGLLRMFTAETKAPFMLPEIVDRLAAMMDLNLEALVGPRCADLKVKNPEKYKFEPRELLKELLQIYLNLADQNAFAEAVAGDGRSYRKELFERAGAIAKHRALKSDPEIELLRQFVVRVEEKKATIEAEEDLGEIPDEFMDPLLFVVMRDPVILPSSRAVIDRSTIKSHLLSDTTDPFNRQPLSIDDVIPNVELKAKIDSFLSERRNKHTALDIPEDEIVNMDVDVSNAI